MSDIAGQLAFAARRMKRIARTLTGGTRSGDDYSDYHHHRKSFFEELGCRSDVVFVGDSITCNADWREVFPGLNATNRGVISDRTDGVLHRIDSILSTRAHTAFVMIGFNDIHQGFKVDQVFANYEKLVERLVESGMHVFVQSTLFAGTQHVQLNPAIGRLNERLQALCERFDGATYIDLNQALAFDGKLSSEYSRDGVHLNGHGYVAWRDAIGHLISAVAVPDQIPSADQ
tara:strand:+ start:140101 stop:140793 length:693 start_codon:yes stop_codon:yes gene_type:complete